MRNRQIYELDYHYCPNCAGRLFFAKHDGRQVLSCSKCNFIFWNNPHPVVSALITHDNKILLIKRNKDAYKNYWALPGGVINYLEKPEEALTREVREETGLNLTSAELIDAYLIVYAPHGLTKKPSHTSVDIIYKVQVAEDLNRPLVKADTVEVRAMRLFTKKNIPKKIAFGHKKILDKFFK